MKLNDYKAAVDRRFALVKGHPGIVDFIDAVTQEVLADDQCSAEVPARMATTNDIIERLVKEVRRE